MGAGEIAGFWSNGKDPQFLQSARRALPIECRFWTFLTRRSQTGSRFLGTDRDDISIAVTRALVF